MVVCTESYSFNLPLREAFGYQTPIRASEFTPSHASQCLSAYTPTTTSSDILDLLNFVFDVNNLIAHLVDLIWHASTRPCRAVDRLLGRGGRDHSDEAVCVVSVLCVSGEGVLHITWGCRSFDRLGCFDPECMYPRGLRETITRLLKHS